MKPGTHIDYKALRKVNAEAATLTVIEYLSSNGDHISEAAAMFGIQRATVYDILRKHQGGDLTDRSKAPKTSPGKTAPEVEDKVIELKNQTHLGPYNTRPCV
jgi:transposase